ncbi:hypothetical protein NQZ79_g1760 [Umbelopsis isabellina]|nr:hypothetical protein NQZ79_g1760 [Umbelopsis isabellina]
MTINNMSVPNAQGESLRKIMLDILNQLREERDLTLFIISAADIESPILRFIEVVRYFASGWHIQPKVTMLNWYAWSFTRLLTTLAQKGAKKPYNPVLGEIFRSRYAFNDGSKGFYLAEQVSHHPPISAYFFANPQKGITIQGDLRPKGKFLGNSAATLLHGSTDIVMLSRDETYRITFPNVYAKGVLVGNLRMEVGDRSSIICEKNNLVCHLDFKTTGMFCKDMHQLRGEIKDLSTGDILFKITGDWMGKLYITDTKTNQESLFLDIETLQVQKLLIQDDSEQQSNESRQVWKSLTTALKTNDLDTANKEKRAVEEHQRNLVKMRQEQNISWSPHYFDLVNNEYSLKGYSRFHSLNMNNASEADVQLDNLVYQGAEQDGLSE